MDSEHGTLIIDGSGRIRYCSSALCALAGREAQELRGKTVSILLPDYDPVAAIGTDWEAAVGPRHDRPPALRLSCSDGRSFPVEVTAEILPGQWTGLQVLEVRLCETRLGGIAELQRLTWSVEQSSDAVVITDAAGIVQYVNPAFETMSGFTRSEAIGRTPALVKSGHHDTDFYRPLWNNLCKGKEFRAIFINRKKSGELFHAEQVIRPFFGPEGRATHFVSIMRDVSDRLREFETLTHDSLTDLPNRRLFFDRLGQAVRQALRRNSGFAVAVVDLDQFKTINDLYGHLGGDAVLQAVASRLQHCVRNEDTVARLGGDEFGLILLDTADQSMVAALLDKTLHSFTAPVAFGNQTIPATVSIGVCLYPRDASEEGDLVGRADEAMYRAKRTGGNSYQFPAPPLARDPP